MIRCVRPPDCNGTPRRAEVEIICGAQQNELQDVQETSTCNYALKIGVTTTCEAWKEVAQSDIPGKVTSEVAEQAAPADSTGGESMEAEPL